MKAPVAVLTMVKDDYFFLERWVAYYGGLFGRSALYVVNHGGDAKVDALAEGCSVIRIPAFFDGSFDAKRWRMLTQFAGGLRSYHDFVICGDVDEFIVLDPKTGMTLPEFLSKRKPDQVITPIGLEVVHRADEEPEPIGASILEVRRFARYHSFYSKPCIIGTAARLSRGGHYSDFPELRLFRNLYLFHMKYCDRGLRIETARRRAELARKTVTEAGEVEGTLSADWYVEEGQEAAELDKLAAMPVREEFVLDDIIAEMQASFGPRMHGLYHFKKRIGRELYPLPERFAGLV